MRGAPPDVAPRIVANLERWRWLPRDLGPRYLVVNTPAFTVELRLRHRGYVEIERIEVPLANGAALAVVRMAKAV